MLEKLIRACLRQRALTLVLALVVMALGIRSALTLPKDVLPELTRPTVTLLTPAPGLAPEEVEASVATPLERAIRGVPGLGRLRTRIEPGLALIIAEFDYGADTGHIRRVVQERMAGAETQLPAGVVPEMIPETSLMGEILLVGFQATDDVPAARLRDLAERTVRPALLGVRGVAEIAPIGGGVLRYEIAADPDRMRALGVSWEETLAAARNAGLNVSAGFAVGPEKEHAVRVTGRELDPAKIALTPVKFEGGRRVLLSDYATVSLVPAPMRGDARVNGVPGVILGVTKQPGIDTPDLSKRVEEALTALTPSLPKGVKPVVLFRQSEFIGLAADNLVEALRDGALMVGVVLILFLANLRTTLVTLTAIPLSLAVSALTFSAFGMSVNAMTLGGLAVAVGLVVDDAVVDVENVFRRLREKASQTGATLDGATVRETVAEASVEVRSGILYATVLIALAFSPLYALPGIEGRLFAPVATATIVAMLASFVVSLTVVPALASLLLPKAAMKSHREGVVLRTLKKLNLKLVLGPALRHPWAACLGAIVLLAGAFSLLPRLGSNFLPSFNEGSLLVSMITPPGTSITRADELGASGSDMLLKIPEIASVGQRVGRAENSDHVMGVNVVEYDIEFKPGGRPRGQVIADVRDRLASIPGTALNVGQPLAHRLSHMISGVSAQIAVKLYGDDTDRALAHAAKLAEQVKKIPGATDVSVERIPSVPQYRVIPDRERCAAAGVAPGSLTTLASGMIGGAQVAEVRDGALTRPVVVRAPESYRASPETMRELPVAAPDGRTYRLGDLADVREDLGPPQINRENGERRVLLSANVSGADLGAVAGAVGRVISANPAPQGVRVSLEGEYEARRSSGRTIAVAAAGALVLAAALLYSHFGSLSLTLQVLVNIPLAMLGGLVGAWWLLGDISVATLIGFVAVAGIGARNTIMMLDHYLHLMRSEGEVFGRAMVVRGSQERLAPVMMTALAAGIALVPLLLAAGEPGKELLHPIAVVICGGLLSSTLLDIAITPTVFLHFGKSGAMKALTK